MKTFIRVNESLEVSLETAMTTKSAEGWVLEHIADNGPRYAVMSKDTLPPASEVKDVLSGAAGLRAYQKKVKNGS